MSLSENIEVFRINKITLFYGVLSFIFICAFSYIISFYLAPLGRDYDNYALYYNSLSNSTQDLAGERFEFGFQALANFTAYFFPFKVNVLYFVIITMSLYLKFLIFLRLSKNTIELATLFFILYLLSFLLVFEVNQVRAAMAISFGFLAIYAFSKNRVALAFILAFLSFSFHYSAIVFLIGIFCIFMVGKNLTKLLFIIIIIGCIASKYLITIIEALNPIAAEYQKNYEGASFGLTTLTFVFPMLFFIYHSFSLSKENKYNKSMLLFLFAGLLFSLTMSSIPVYAIRILEMIEVSCLFISINRNYNSVYSYGSLGFAFLMVLHKFIAYAIVNPLFYL